MSYCVHCGVKLEESIKRCPLCNTLVLDPNELTSVSAETKSGPFPSQKGDIDIIRKTDVTILLSVVLASSAITCFLLNLIIYKQSWWSFHIIGICGLIWVFIFPPILHPKISKYTLLLLDFVSVSFYIYVVSLLATKSDWFFPIAFPIILGITLLIGAIVFFIHRFSFSFLSTALYIVISIGILCALIEVCLDLYFKSAISLTWSAVVLTVAIIIAMTLATALSNRKFRNAIRRRLHF